MLPMMVPVAAMSQLCRPCQPLLLVVVVIAMGKRRNSPFGHAVDEASQCHAARVSNERWKRHDKSGRPEDAPSTTQVPPLLRNRRHGPEYALIEDEKQCPQHQKYDSGNYEQDPL